MQSLTSQDMSQEAMASAVAFSWEEEPGVSKESPKEKPGPALEARKMPESPPRSAPNRPRVPPPPGPVMVPAPAPRRRLSRRGVRPEEDPFLAAYLACTMGGKKPGSTVREPKGPRRSRWAGLGLSCKSSHGAVEDSMVRAGLGLSCKSARGAVKDSMVRLVKAPEVDPRDA